MEMLDRPMLEVVDQKPLRVDDQPASILPISHETGQILVPFGDNAVAVLAKSKDDPVSYFLHRNPLVG